MNRAALLSNARIEQLYDICVANGYNRDYQNFRGLINGTMDADSEIGLTGSVYRFIFGKDIAVEGVIPGLGGTDGRSTFQIEISIKNINQTTALPITFYMVALTEGVLQIIPQGAVQTLAPIDNVNEVYNAPVVGIPYNAYKEMIGGGIWDTLKGLGATALQVGLPLAATAINPALAGPAAMIGNMASSLLAPKAAGGRRGGIIAGGRRGGVIASGGQQVMPSELRMIKQKRF